MPPRYKKLQEESASSSSSDSEPVPPFPEGEILTDRKKTKWRLGKFLSSGGFGAVYLASNDITKPVKSNARYVIKIEPYASETSVIERTFYSRAGKVEIIEEWIEKKNLVSLGMPHIFGAGSHVHDGKEYRFLVIPKFGEELTKKFYENGSKFHIKTALTLALYVVDILEYIHSRNYVHRDIKLENLLLGIGGSQAPVYLVDFGLVYQYRHPNGQHKKFRADKRQANHGTPQFNSRDAHEGGISRKGDMESLGFNIIHWLTGNLPWDDEGDNSDIAFRKKFSMIYIDRFLKSCFKGDQPPDVIVDYLNYVKNLEFDAEPDYEYCRNLFRSGIRKAGFCDDGKLTFKNHSKLKQITGENDLATENMEVEQLKRSRPAQPQRVLRNQNINDQINRVREPPTSSRSVVADKPKRKTGREMAGPSQPKQNAKQAVLTAKCKKTTLKKSKAAKIDKKTLESENKRVRKPPTSSRSGKPKRKTGQEMAGPSQPKAKAKQAVLKAKCKKTTQKKTEAAKIDKKTVESENKRVRKPPAETSSRSVVDEKPKPKTDEEMAGPSQPKESGKRGCFLS